MLGGWTPAAPAALLLAAWARSPDCAGSRPCGAVLGDAIFALTRRAAGCSSRRRFVAADAATCRLLPGVAAATFAAGAASNESEAVVAATVVTAAVAVAEAEAVAEAVAVVVAVEAAV